MQILVTKGDILQSKADLLVVGAYEAPDWQDPFLTRIDGLLNGKFIKLATAQAFSGSVGQSIIFPAPDALPVEYVLVVGLGKTGVDMLGAVREAAGIAVGTAKRMGLTTIALEMFGEDDEEHFFAKTYGQACAEALLLANYQFALYKQPKTRSEIRSIEIVAEDGRDAIAARKGVERAQHIIEGVSLARDLVNTPARDMTPTKLAQTAQGIAADHETIQVKIYDRAWCEKKGMGAYLAVSQGSEEEPKFIHLVYKGPKAKKKIAVVGKGVTFDSGGLSLKPANYMESMKCDMAGGAAVLGLFRVLGALQPNVEVHGIIAATENLPSGRAMKPGDVVRSASGKTIEILNTDAEGRLTLADALFFATEQNPDAIIDLATLTGACMVALGEEVAGVMGTSAKFTNDILTAASAAAERIWELPLEPRYRKQIESDVADLRNIATSAYGGTLTAGLFLQEFVPAEIPWAHIDIAGPAYAERPMSSYLGKGGTGFGIRTVLNVIEAL